MHRTHSLQQEMLISLPARRGSVLALEAGAIWFTMDGRDIVLTDGQTFRLEKDATLLVQAFSYARLRLAQPASAGLITALLNLAKRIMRKRQDRTPVCVAGPVKA